MPPSVVGWRVTLSHPVEKEIEFEETWHEFETANHRISQSNVIIDKKYTGCEHF
jgi:hypothetical protein